MEPSKLCPMYSLYILTSENLNIDLSQLVTSFDRSEPEKQIAQKVTVSFMNVQDSNGRMLEDYINVRDRVFVYANDGETIDEVFRGMVWTKRYVNKQKKEITLTCYDQLIYFQKTEDNKFYPEGMETENICNTLCSDWGVSLIWNYQSITHTKLMLTGKLSDIFLTDILAEVKKKVHLPAVMKSVKDVVYIETVGVNSKIYEIKRGENAISTTSTVTMDDVVTRVVITGKQDDDGCTPVEATVDGDTERFGTIQKIIRKNENTEMSEVKEEAQDIIDENGYPKMRYEIEAIDIPWIRRGDKVKIVAGDMALDYWVLSIEHDAVKKTMTLKTELATNGEKPGGNSDKNGDTSAGKELNLSNTPIYVSSDAAKAAGYVSGTYFLYDGEEILGRYRITDNRGLVNIKPVNQNVTGWIDKEYAV